jgi:hypothetical protein
VTFRKNLERNQTDPDEFRKCFRFTLETCGGGNFGGIRNNCNEPSVYDDIKSSESCLSLFANIT